jgi:hypothetical protein
MYKFQYRTHYQIPTIQDFLDNFAYEFAHTSYTDYMISNPLFLERFMRIAEIYLTNKINNTEYKPGEIASIIRDLLFIYLNPLPLFDVSKMNSVTICNDINENPISPNIPQDLMPSIYGYLDYTSRFSFAQTSKNAYFFHKKEIDKPCNVFYVLGNEVQITESEGMWGLTEHKSLVNSISSGLILQSILSMNNLPTLKAFTSLFHAIEYAHHQKHDDAGYDKEKDGFMPTIWAVLYVGNRDSLVFTEEVIHINEGRGSAEYEGNSRLVWLEKGEMPHNAFIPLKGMALHAHTEFAEYKVFNQFDFIKTIQEQDEYGCTLF